MRKRNRREPKGALALRIREVAAEYSIGQSIVWNAIKSANWRLQNSGPTRDPPSSSGAPPSIDGSTTAG